MRNVLIVGGGASGILVATNLLRHAKDQTSIVVADPRFPLGRGIAYSAQDPSHVLNVPAGRMSMFVDDPNHFVNWSQSDKNYFAPRMNYGDYLAQTYMHFNENSAVATSEHVQLSVNHLEKTKDGWSATLSDEVHKSFDAVVIALGHGKAFALSASISSSKNYIEDAWRDNYQISDGVLLGIGTGLTFVDHALSHLRKSDKNSVIGISRNGLLPQSHLPNRAEPLPVDAYARTTPDAVRKFIESSNDWRAAQDGIRHELPEIWHAWDDEKKNKFLKEQLRWWNVHRHRLSPEIGQEIQDMIAIGRLRIIATELISIDDSDERSIAHFADGTSLAVNSVLNCLGYQTVGDEGLLGSLFKSGVASLGPLNLGLITNFPDYQVVAKNGEVHKNLFALGPILFGERFETTAIPEIRVQADSIALSILNY